METKELIGYVRVSTDEQGKTRNGLEAQMDAIRAFAQQNGYKLIDIVEEVRSGADDERPVLAAATKRAEKIGAYIVVNKLDRLSRDALFILQYIKTNRRFIVTALGEHVDPFMLHIYAGFAEQERLMISQRTKAGLAAKKARGEAVGASREVISKVATMGRQVQASKADEFAIKLKPTVKRMVDANMSLREIADELNANGTRTARGGAWAATTVKNLIARF